MTPAWVRPNRYEFVLQDDGWRGKKTVAVASFEAHTDGEATASFHFEVRHPEKTDWDKMETTPPRVEKFEGPVVYSYGYVKRPGTETKFYEESERWLIRDLIIALGRDEVHGKSASDMVYRLFSALVLSDDPWWIKENAPEYWRLMRRTHEKTGEKA